jgi:lysozyme
MREILKRQLIKHEGEVNHAYKDSEGYLTIGVGRLIDKKKGGSISHAEAMFLLDNDIKSVIQQCEREFHWYPKLSENRQAVVANMVFNLGLEGFKKFKRTIHFLRLGMFQQAADEMLDSKWANQVGNRALELADLMREG